MSRYETLILTSPEITEDEVGQLERHFYNHLVDDKGQVTAFDKWGKFRLAYPIKKNDYGVYILIRYEAAEDYANTFMKELDTFFKIKCNDFVMRHTTIKLKKNAPTTYIKPESLDSARSSSVESFLKDNKMEGLLSSVGSNIDINNNGKSNGPEHEEEKPIVQG
jgi:small subunit ribosomal protein S6